ncbi:hypothetical protein MKQ70_05585 [Chitinophaga sedimenti]|uniref:hypothetical protein n=1 Tax=Chitinophaga sedimenti TaxID=2033606 RepID=UPI002005DA1C|nr:hypothetical protein [Chitinophaga sedimenti]MCK7554504.1 hypothetical protein [Chitinophaga sedimenti]
MKKYMLSLALLAIAAGTFYAVKAQTKPSTIGYYQYVGNPYDAYERTDPTNYVFVANQPPTSSSCGQGSDNLCGVYTNGSGTYPYIVPNGELELALENNDQMVGVIYYSDAMR